LLKIVAGKSTLAPVSGIAYLCHPNGWAYAAEIVKNQANAKIVRTVRSVNCRRRFKGCKSKMFRMSNTEGGTKRTG
jgi:hypothetical protein